MTWGSYHITSVLGGETVGEVGGGRGKGAKLKKGHNSFREQFQKDKFAFGP